ncbi:zinc finger SWIM domain-containing protein 3 [Phyllobates terribilis]|uniref:zinc finger SWIM domain-containing protein 3 n=1 Tax=Phyllobates terribilis TaxID=111132 RepID=UPI003CCB71A4
MDQPNSSDRLTTMQQGTCFINYADFQGFFTAFKKDTNSNYSIQSSVSVHHHNSKFSIRIRPDIIYTEVTFCCSTLQGHNGKRKPDHIICPAFFVLHYDTDLDCLVVKEECSTHIHSKDTTSPQASLIHPPETGELSPNSEVPFKKICNESLSLSPKKEHDQKEVQQDSQSSCKAESNLPSEMQDIDDEGNSKPTSATIKDSSPEGLSIDAFSRVDGFIKDFQKVDAGSKSLLTVGVENQVERLCFQTSTMSQLFLKFPESILLHKVSSKIGCTLYALLVETKERMAKIVYFSFVKEENAKNISKMLETFKLFNSEWSKVKVIHTDTAFKQVDVLKETFPSRQVLLSVYHTARLIEKKTKGSAQFRYCISKLIEDAVYETTPLKLSCLAQKLEHKLDKDLYAKLCKEWFSNELVWYMHVKKGILSCTTYMDSVEIIDVTISSCLTNQSSMENAIQEFLKSADCFNKEGKRKGVSPGFYKKLFTSQPQITTNKVCQILPTLQSPPSDSKAFSKPMQKKATKWVNKYSSVNNGLIVNPKLGVWKPVRLINKMLVSLKESCNEVAFQLCSKEWEVVLRSTHLINVQTSFTTVQILEESHSVCLSEHSCTCYFNKGYKLPCRHILSMLYLYQKPVEENMVSLRWRKNYLQPISDSRVYDKVLHYTKTKAETMERIDIIKSLTKELYNLIMQCDVEEMQDRISTLQMMADMWHNDSIDMSPFPKQEKEPELPYHWVKIEPVEGKNSSGYELCRLDRKSPLELKMNYPELNEICQTQASYD